MTTDPKPRARGQWQRQQERTHTFEAASGHTARLEPDGPTRYRAEIRDPQGLKILGMELHLNLQDAKLTVAERIHQLENKPEPR